MIGIDALSTTKGAITACSPTIAPSTITAREPMNAPSSTITGRASRGPAPRRDRGLRASPRRSQRRPEDRRGALALLQRRHEREPRVAFTRGPEVRAGRDDDAVLE